MNLYLKNKVFLITGSSKGIGKVIAKHFLNEGATVILVARDTKVLFKTQTDFQSHFNSEKVHAYACDCTNLIEVESLKNKIELKWSKLDGVVSNIGNGRSPEDLMFDKNQWDKIWDINFGTALNISRQFIPILESSNGCMVFISSIAGIEAIGAPLDYSTAKSALNFFVKNLSKRVAPRIRVNLVAPGNVYFQGSTWEDKIKKDQKKVEEMIKKNVPMKRFATPEEIADPVIFLCSDKASFITGSLLVVDGGQTACL